MTLKDFEELNATLRTCYIVKYSDGSKESFVVDYNIGDKATLYGQINYRVKFNDFIVEGFGVSEISGEFVVVVKEGDKK